MFAPVSAFAQMGTDTLSKHTDEATIEKKYNYRLDSQSQEEDNVTIRTVSFRPQDVQAQDRFRPTANDFLFPTKWWRKRYLAIGGGIMGLSDNVSSVSSASFNLYMGFMFTPVHNLRLHGFYNSFEYASNKSSSKSLSMGLDYMTNLTNLAWGYNPFRLFDVSTVLGGGVRINSVGLPHKITPYIHMGLHGDLHLSSNFSLFVEPYVGMHRNMDVLFSRPSREMWNLMYGVNAGLQMNLNKRDNRFAGSDSIYTQFFFDTSTGVAVNGRAGGLTHRAGHGYSAAVGMWFNPMLGIRLGAQAQTIHWSSGMTNVNGSPVRKSLNQAFLSGRAEFLLNPMNFSRRWRNAKGGHNFDFNLLFGGDFGMAIKADMPTVGNGQYRTFYYGFTGALQAMYRISKPGTYIFIEPRYSAATYKVPYQTANNSQLEVDHNLALNIGTRVYINRAANAENNTDDFVPHWWVGLDFGGMKLQRSQSISSGGIGFNPTLGLSLGYDWTRYVTLRMQLAYLRLHDTHMSSYVGIDSYDRTRSGYGLWNSAYDDLDVRLTYMLNLNNVLQGYNSNRRFNLWLNAGPTFTYFFNQSDKWADKQKGKLPQMSRFMLSDRRQGKASHGMVASMMATFRVIPSMDVSAEVLGQYNFLAGTNPGNKGRLNNLKYGFTIGTRYHMEQDALYDFFHGTEVKPWQKGWELTASYGWTQPLYTRMGLRASGCNMAVGAGYWFNSLLGARLGLVGQQTYYNKNSVSAVIEHASGKQIHAPYSIYYSQFVLGARVEAMINPLNIIPSRRNKETAPRWDMALSAGVNFGAMAKTSSGIAGGYVGFTASAAAYYRLSDEVQLYIEPRYDVNKYKRYSDVFNCNESLFDRFFTVSIGTRITRPVGNAPDSKKATTPAEMAHRGWWVGGGIGGTKMVQMIRKSTGAKVQPSIDFYAGYDFTRLHGLRLNMNYDIQYRLCTGQPYEVMVSDKPKRYSGTINSTFHQLDMQLLYMLNISNLWTGCDRRNALNIYIEAGPMLSTLMAQANSLAKGEIKRGTDFHYLGTKYAGKCSGGLSGGVLVAMPVHRNWDVTAEVLGQYYLNRTLLPENASRFINSTKINFTLGTRYNF